MRNISFSLTTSQFLAGTKDVTRRMGWEFLRSGEELCVIEKGQGLAKGEKVKRLGLIGVKDVRREYLDRLIEDLDYGFAETAREGFRDPHPYHWPSEFVHFFCKSHRGCYPSKIITRIEFVKLEL